MKIKQFFIFALLVGLMYGCSREDDECQLSNNNNDNTETGGQNENDNQEEDTRYYVKYEAYMPYAGFSATNATTNITFTTEDGIENIDVSGGKWDGIYGPFPKNSSLYLEVRAGNSAVSNKVDSYVRLSVSRNKEPFVIKGETCGRGVTELKTSYTIDF